MSPRHCLLFAETKSERSTEKNNRRDGEDGKIRSLGTTLRPGMGQECVTARPNPNIRMMASAKSRPEITRLPLEAIGAIAIYRIRAARQRSGLLSLPRHFSQKRRGERRVRRELELKS